MLPHFWAPCCNTGQQGGDFVHKDKTTKFTCLTWWENDPLQSVTIKSAEQTKESREIPSPQITAHGPMAMFYDYVNDKYHWTLL